VGLGMTRCTLKIPEAPSKIDAALTAEGLMPDGGLAWRHDSALLVRSEPVPALAPPYIVSKRAVRHV
jgi:hypothetical protein